MGKINNIIYLGLISLIFINNTYSQWDIKDVSAITTSNFNKVYFLDSLQGWCVGYNGVIIHTNDGGDNWELQQDNISNNNIKDVVFIDSLVGFYLSENGLYKTINSGQDWTQLSLPNGGDKICFFDSIRGIIVGNGGIFKTIDGGNNWELIENSVGANSYFVVDSNNIWASTNTKIFQYNGVNWIEKYYNGNDDFYSTYVVDSNNIWSVGANGKILYSDDNGDSWIQQATNWSEGYLFSAYFINENNGWAVGDYGKVFRFDGVSWSEENSNIGQMLSSVIFTTSNIGWATSWGGKLIYRDILTSNKNTKPLIEKFKVYPNPSNNIIQIKTYNTMESKISIYNIKGEKVYSKLSYENNEKINISNFQSGIYVIEVENNNSIETKKIMKE